MLIDMNDLPPALRDHINALRALVQNALLRFHEKQRELRVDYSARTEASIIHDYMVREAKGAGYNWKVRRNLFLFRVGEDYSVKPKKLDRALRPRNIQTQFVLDFERQNTTALFEDLDLTNLFLGYQRDGAELVTSSVWLVCPQGKGMKWAAELRAEAASNAAVEVAVPAATVPTEVERRRVSPKKRPETKTAEASNE